MRRAVIVTQVLRKRRIETHQSLATARIAARFCVNTDLGITSSQPAARACAASSVCTWDRKATTRTPFLSARSQPIAAIQRLRAEKNGVRVVAFLSHVQTELAAQARAAGCDEVMPRSVFTQNLAAILAVAKD